MTANAPSPHDVTIPVDDLTLAGHLRIPANAPAGPLPALVFTGPFTAVKGQVAGHYGQLLSDRGFVTLAFDHRNFGASGGRRRQHEDPAGKLADLSAATILSGFRRRAGQGAITVSGAGTDTSRFIGGCCR